MGAAVAGSGARFMALDGGPNRMLKRGYGSAVPVKPNTAWGPGVYE
jgi:hypothetical protein